MRKILIALCLALCLTGCGKPSSDAFNEETKKTEVAANSKDVDEAAKLIDDYWKSVNDADYSSSYNMLSVFNKMNISEGFYKDYMTMMNSITMANRECVILEYPDTEYHYLEDIEYDKVFMFNVDFIFDCPLGVPDNIDWKETDDGRYSMQNVYVYVVQENSKWKLFSQELISIEDDEKVRDSVSDALSVLNELSQSAEQQPEKESVEENNANKEKTELSKKEKEKLEISTVVRGIANYDSTYVTSVSVNEDLGTESEGDYIVLAYLKWEVENSAKTTKEMLSMYSSDLAANVGTDLENVNEISVFWIVPYFSETDNIIKHTYTRKSEGMFLTDEMVDSILN